MTSKTRSFRLSPALVISCLALFVALTGGAFAAGIAKNTVRSPQIVDGTVRTVDLRDNSVAAGKIAPDAVDTTEIAENGVESSDVAPETLTSADLGAASVTSSEVADQSLTANDLGPDSVGSSELQTGSVRAAELGTIIQVSNAVTIKAGANEAVNGQLPCRHNRDQRRRPARPLRGRPGRQRPQRQRLGGIRPQQLGQRHHPHRLRLLPLRRQQQLTTTRFWCAL